MAVTAVVTVPIPEGLTRGQYAANTRAMAPRFQGVPGLLRKNFIFDGEARLAGGVYTWASREAGERFHAPGGEWRANLVRVFGAEPTIRWFDTAVIVDNEQNRIAVED